MSDLKHGSHDGLVGLEEEVCHSSEVRRWNVTANGNLMMKKRQLGKYLCCWVGPSHFQNVIFLNYK